jgi:6-phosphogluconolactonase
VRIFHEHQLFFFFLSFYIDITKENYTAELQLTPNNNQLLVSNRGDDNIVIFNITDKIDQVLNVKQHLDCCGSFPRYFTFDPTGKYLLIANQQSNNLICYSYDCQIDSYQYLSMLNDISSPQHMIFL